ncbi:hypothetical protein ES703_105893 [subsurface metagenome]
MVMQLRRWMVCLNKSSHNALSMKAMHWECGAMRQMRIGSCGCLLKPACHKATSSESEQRGLINNTQQLSVFYSRLHLGG